MKVRAGSKCEWKCDLCSAYSHCAYLRGGDGGKVQCILGNQSILVIKQFYPCFQRRAQRVLVERRVQHNPEPTDLQPYRSPVAIGLKFRLGLELGLGLGLGLAGGVSSGGKGQQCAPCACREEKGHQRATCHAPMRR
jgi:hypothetical protein